jgi:hypothetical protein
MNLNKDLIQELREMAGCAIPPSQLILHIGDRLGVRDTNFRLLAIAYFREAFALSLHDATNIGASSIFPDGARHDNELNEKVIPMIQQTKHLWGAQGS